jgi:aminopeptidase N
MRMSGISEVKVAALFFFVLLAATALSAGEPLNHSITVSIYPPDKSLLATDTVFVDTGHLDNGRIAFLINKSLVVDNVQPAKGIKWYSQEDIEPSMFVEDPDQDDLDLIAGAKGVFIEIEEDLLDGRPIPIAITYSGEVYDSLRPPDRMYAKGFATTTGLIDQRGGFLTNESVWYPFQFDRSLTFKLTVDLPADWMSISQGALKTEYMDDIRGEKRVVDVWVERNPTPELYLVAGRYYRHQEVHNGTRIMTYTYQPSDSLSRVYLDATRRYISMYEDLIGDYPHPKFAMVENFWQTGYGMPSFTLLGDRVIRLPFIVHTSYGHEILHNWWGNGVFVDYDSGNWCEGLTTYGADYLYKEQMGEEAARDYRHETLIAFNNYVTEAEDFPLSEFRERHNSASQSVGYGKSLMVFHMLRRSLGDDVFWQALRDFYAMHKFEVASWKDLQQAFSRASGRELGWYFDQWVNRTGRPDISLKSAAASRQGESYATDFTLAQAGEPFVLDVPVVVSTETGKAETIVHMEGPEKECSLKTSSKPLSLAVDPDFNLFRKLYPEEIPVTIGRALAGRTDAMIIGNREGEQIQRGMGQIAHSLDMEAAVVLEDESGGPGPAGSNFWFLGRGDALAGALEGSRVSVSGGTVRIGGMGFDVSGRTLVCALHNPRDEESIAALIISGDMNSLPSIVRKLPHYAKYSYLIFDGDKPVERGVWETEKSPLAADLTAMQASPTW